MRANIIVVVKRKNTMTESDKYNVNSIRPRKMGSWPKCLFPEQSTARKKRYNYSSTVMCQHNALWFDFIFLIW